MPRDETEGTRGSPPPIEAFWTAVQQVQGTGGRQGVTDADMLAGLFEVGDSTLVRMIEADGGDLEATRVAIADAVSAEAEVMPGPTQGMTQVALGVAEVMFEERRVRGGVQRQEHVLLGLLLAGGARVKGVLAELGIDRERVLRELASSRA